MQQRNKETMELQIKPHFIIRQVSPFIWHTNIKIKRKLTCDLSQEKPLVQKNIEYVLICPNDI